MTDYISYDNPLLSRYASKEMSELFSPQRKFSTWRRLWLALAEAEKELGIGAITDEALNAMRSHLDDIDFEKAAEIESKVRHDVMAHVQTFGEACPSARGIIHLGATSCFVTDNADLVILRGALGLLRRKMVSLMNNLADFAKKYKDVPTLGFTHFQPAQCTTVGKRATLWLHDFLLDFRECESRISLLSKSFRGAKGTTGTQESFKKLFEAEFPDKFEDEIDYLVRTLDERVTAKAGFEQALPVTGQTYTRKLDSLVLAVLAGLAESAAKFATDVRLLASRKEIEEPFEKNQIGSSAMAYKRNPMRSERVCSLARYMNSLCESARDTAMTQWLERTLDDSAGRRLYIPEAFLSADAILNLLLNITSGLVVYENRIKSNLMEELPFMATEAILMRVVAKGKDRQEAHEHIRVHSQEAALEVKQNGGKNDLLSRLKNDPLFVDVKDDIDNVTDPAQFIGRAPKQVEEFLRDYVQPVLDSNRDHLTIEGDVRV
ncbi:MAG: adenylosuccinate lyase [Planctomycetes bacterium]|nr:adenylosuccinate lyase [Planctomycetota bacterium]